MPEILLAEDDSLLCRIISGDMAAQGFLVSPCPDAKSALKTFKARKFAFDACLISANLPAGSGIALAAQIRKLDSRIPIVILATDPTLDAIIEYYKAGADTYIDKPLNFKLLPHQLTPLLKRTKKLYADCAHVLRIGDWELNCWERRLASPLVSTPLKLSGTMMALTKLFATHPNRMLSRGEILQSVWGKVDHAVGRTMDVYICRLRNYFKDDPRITIRTEVAKGFMLKIL